MHRLLPSFRRFIFLLLAITPCLAQTVIRERIVINPLFVLLDTLISYKHQVFALGWLGDKNFVNELEHHLDNAKRHLTRSDSLNTAQQVRLFQEKVHREHERTEQKQQQRKNPLGLVTKRVPSRKRVHATGLRKQHRRSDDGGPQTVFISLRRLCDVEGAYNFT